ncbi:MAG: iron transporter substrate-binding protein [Dehalococcoidia bacterium]|nr:iron transporter substrate-binding protein [Dehalococcoidia bacterium]
MRNPGYWLLTLVLAFGLVLAACAAPAPAPAPSTPTPTPASPAAPALGTAKPAAGVDQQVIEAAKKEGQVVVWTNTITDLDRIKKQFNEKYPFIELKVWDARSVEILAKLAEEAKAGKFTADFVTTTENDTIDLRELGIIQSYAWPAVTRTWTNQPKDDFYRVHIANLRVHGFNTNLISPQEVPKTWDDLKDAKWRGRTMVSNSGDENPLDMAYVWGEGGKLNWEKSEKFWTDVVQNTRPLVVRGYPMEMIAAGERPLFISAASITLQALIDRGAPLNYAPLSPVVAVNFAMSVPKNPPHPNAARLFVENISAAEGLLTWSEANRSLVFDPVVAKQSRIHKIVAERGITYVPIPADILTDENMKRSSEFWLKALGVRG